MIENTISHMVKIPFQSFRLLNSEIGNDQVQTFIKYGNR